jgi:sugar lactone lactonase YvrE
MEAPMAPKTMFTLALLLVTAGWSRPATTAQPAITRLVGGLEGASGSTVGPDGALYVTEGAAGRVSRVDPRTGQVTVFASGLPRSIIGFGGPTDIAFIGDTAYVIVTLVGPQFGGSDTVGIYRLDGPTSFTPIADIGTFAVENPPDTPFEGMMGLQYAMEPYAGGFLVTDGHHNRVLRVTRHGRVSVFRAFGNVVPTGLELFGPFVLMAQAGPLPHLPENGKIVAFGPGATKVVTLGSGAPLLVDVEFGPGFRLYGLSQGHFTPGNPEGSPADPGTGALVELKPGGRLQVVADGLNQPTSLEFIGDTAYVVTFAGEIWKIRNVGRPHGHGW